MKKYLMPFAILQGLILVIACKPPGPSADTAAPVITGAKLAKTTLTLTMGETLAARAEINGSGGFALTGSEIGSPTKFTVLKVAAVAPGATTLILTLDKGAQPGEKVTLTYKRPEDPAQHIRDTAGNVLASWGSNNDFTTVSVTEAVDRRAPPDANAVTTITSSNGNTTYSDQSAASADKVLNKADEAAIKGTAFKLNYTFAQGVVFESGATAVLYQGPNQVGAEATSTTGTEAAFAALGGTASLAGGMELTLKFKDAAGNVSNGIKAAEVDTAAPTVTAADVEEAALDKIVLTLSENVSGAAAGAGGFTVSRDTGKTAVTVNAVASADDKVTLTLTAALTAGETNVKVNYAANAGNIADTAGNPLDDLAPRAVNVKGTADNRPPPDANAVTSIASSDGNTMYSSATDGWLNKADETAIGGGAFKVSYTFTATFEPDSTAVLYQGPNQVGVDATSTSGTEASFAALGAGISLTTGTDLTLKFRDAAGNVSSGIKAAEVDTIAPTIESASLRYTSLTLRMSEPLAERTAITGDNNSGFTLTGSGIQQVTSFTVTNLALVAPDTNTLTLTVNNGAQPNETIKLTYVQPTDAQRIKDKAGNPLASIAGAGAKTVTVDAHADTAAPNDPAAVTTITSSDGNTTYSNQSTDADKVLNKMDETALKTGAFKIDYSFTLGAGFETGSTAVLYQGANKVGADATSTTGMAAEFAALPASLTSGTALTLKFKDAAGNESTGITAAEVDTIAPTDPIRFDVIRNSSTIFSNQSASSTDTWLNKADETAIKNGEFSAEFYFASELPEEPGETAVLYQGTKQVGAAGTSARPYDTWGQAKFQALGTVSLTSGTPLTLKLKDAAGNVSTGIKAADVDTVPPTVSAADVKESARDKVVLTLSENVNGAPGNAGDYTVSRGTGKPPITVTAAAIADGKVSLTLSAKLAAGETNVKVSYTANTNNGSITDRADNPFSVTDRDVSVEGTEDNSPPPDAGAVSTITSSDGNTTYSNQSTNDDKVLNKEDETAIKAGAFKVRYTFAQGTAFESGSTAVLYQGTNQVGADATLTSEREAEFPALGTAVSLTSGTPLTLKFRDAADNASTGITVADVDTMAPTAPNAVTTITSSDGVSTYSDQSANSADRWLNIADETAIKGAEFKLSYTFAQGTTFESASIAGLYQGTTQVGAAPTSISGTEATFAALGGASLTSGTALTLKFKDAAGNVSTGIKVADVDTVAPKIVSAKLTITNSGRTQYINVTVDEDLKGFSGRTGAMTPEGFTLTKAPTGEGYIGGVTVNENAPRIVNLAGITGITSTDTVTLTYTPTATGEQITDAVGNPLASTTAGIPVSR